MISSAKVSAFCHLSEDRRKVETAFLNCMPKKLQTKFNTEKKLGYFKNEILVFSKDLKKNAAKLLSTFLSEKLPAEDKAKLLAELSERLQGSTLFFRLDKQKALEGILSLTDGEDAVQISISIATFPRNEAKILEEIREVFS